jgi:hypothetical protein
MLSSFYSSSAWGMVNIRNQDDICLKHCIAAATNPPKNNASRVPQALHCGSHEPTEEHGFAG